MPRHRSNPFETHRRLSPTELDRLGYSRSARRYVKKSTKRLVRGKTTTIPYRQYEQTRILAETGRRVSLERKTRELASGQRQYRSESIRNITIFKRKAREIRRDVDHITLKDVKLIVKWQTVGWHGLTSEEENEPIIYENEQERFSQLFKLYPREQILAGLGSPVTMYKGHAA